MDDFDFDFEYRPHICIREGYWRVLWKRWGVIVPADTVVPRRFRISDDAIAAHTFASRLNGFQGIRIGPEYGQHRYRIPENRVVFQ